MEKYRLHEIEAVLDLYSSEPYIFRPAELYKIDGDGDLRKELERYNIYMVARRPRISIDPNSLNLDTINQTVEGTYVINFGVEVKQKKFVYKNPLDNRMTALGEPAYPYDHIRVVLDYNFHAQIKIQDLIRDSKPSMSPYSDLFVEYVGQSFGDEGDSDALSRLIGKTGKQGHGSLQKVLADINANNPESEAYVLLYSYGYYRKLILGGAGPEPLHELGDNPTRLNELLDAVVPRSNRIDLIEASLIRYFQPKYNDIYKRTFPKKNHEILSELFKLDITGLSVSLATEWHNTRVSSEKIEPSCEHLAIYPIVDDEQRMSFFDLACPMPEIIIE